jgi:hypothetical protein
MHLPHQSAPVERTLDPNRVPRNGDGASEESPTAGGSPRGGVDPSGYSDCYKLRGPAQQMCLADY